MVPWGKENVILIKPDESYAEEIRSYRQEMLLAGSSMDGTSVLKRIEDPLEWLVYVKERELPEHVMEGRVPATQFILVDPETKRILGMLQVRHYLSEYLRNFAGHIGYSVRPTERRKGYARKMLKLALKFCKEELKLDRVLITCSKANTASAKTILSCGGILENEWNNGERVTQRYWIKL